MAYRLKVLLVDDEPEFMEVLGMILERKGCEVLMSTSGRDALERLKEEPFDLLLTDLRMPEIDGMQLLDAVKEMQWGSWDAPECIMITGYGSIANAVEAIKKGAFSYFIKSNDPEELISDVEKISKIRRLRQDNRILKDAAFEGSVLTSLDKGFLSVLRAAEKIAATDANVLLIGESGVGKEVLARHIHQLSGRRERIFMPVNCYAFSETMVEAELYGHEKGAFTGASGHRVGRFEASDGGTLFLDEIGDLPMSIQTKILRNIERKEIERIGSNRTIPVDFRLISATNKDLNAEVAEKRFRKDLLYRINTVILEIPPLRARKADIPMLVAHFMNKIALELKRPPCEIEERLMQALIAYDYPGNVRELKNIMERLIVFSEGNRLRYSDLLEHRILSGSEGSQGSGAFDVEDLSLKTVRSLAEKAHIEAVLGQTDWQLERAAEVLKITSRQLYNKIHLYDLQK